MFIPKTKGDTTLGLGIKVAPSQDAQEDGYTF